MKLISKVVTVLIITHIQLINAQPSKFMILFSGSPSKEFKKVLDKSLGRTLPEWEELSKFEKDNPNCKRREEYLIQFCLKGDQLSIVHQKQRALQRTLSKLMRMEDQGEIKTEADIIKALQ